MEIKLPFKIGQKAFFSAEQGTEIIEATIEGFSFSYEHGKGNFYMFLKSKKGANFHLSPSKVFLTKQALLKSL